MYTTCMAYDILTPPMICSCTFSHLVMAGAEGLECLVISLTGGLFTNTVAAESTIQRIKKTNWEFVFHSVFSPL